MVEELSEDTEITLGTGKMLFLFFGLVAVCAVFFGMGYKVGRDSNKGSADSLTITGASTVTSTSSKAKPAATPDMSFYKVVQQNAPDSQLAPAPNNAQTAVTTANATQPSPGAPTGQPAAPTTTPIAANPTTPDQLSNTNGYLVQVAAVTKQEDADALVDALKKKQYPAFSTSNAVDKLVHVQVGPFSDIKQAEDTRAKLVNDGYNPILKK